MFSGQYSHTLDTKGRLNIPSKFREQLGNEFVVTKGMDGCLFVFDNENWDEFEKKLQNLPTIGTLEIRQYTRFFLAGVMRVEVDKQGRILIPANLRTYANLEKDAILVGVGKRIEIWNADTWLRMEEEVDINEVTKAMAEKGLMI